jgi:hypothetical protein
VATIPLAAGGGPYLLPDSDLTDADRAALDALVAGSPGR